MVTNFVSDTRILNLKARRKFHASPYVIRYVQSSNEARFSPFTPVNTRQCLSTNSGQNISHLTQDILGHAVCGAVGCGTALQAGRSRVRFPMVSLKFFGDIILPAALCPRGRLSL